MKQLHVGDSNIPDEITISVKDEYYGKIDAYVVCQDDLIDYQKCNNTLVYKYYRYNWDNKEFPFFNIHICPHNLITTTTPEQPNDDYDLEEYGYEKLRKDATVVMDNEYRIKDIKIEGYRITKKNNSYFMYNSEDELILSIVDTYCYLQHGDCWNFAFFYKKHGLILIKNCGDVCSDIYIYFPELRESS